MPIERCSLKDGFAKRRQDEKVAAVRYMYGSALAFAIMYALVVLAIWMAPPPLATVSLQEAYGLNTPGSPDAVR